MWSSYVWGGHWEVSRSGRNGRCRNLGVGQKHATWDIQLKRSWDSDLSLSRKCNCCKWKWLFRELQGDRPVPPHSFVLMLGRGMQISFLWLLSSKGLQP